MGLNVGKVVDLQLAKMLNGKIIRSLILYMSVH